MKRITHYFLITAVIFFLTLMILGVFYFRYVYTSLVNNSNDNFPPVIVKIINKLTNRQAETEKIKPKEESTIQILEGWTNRDIEGYLDDNNIISAADFAAASKKDFSSEFSFLADKPRSASLEGYLFPDTYRVFASSTATEVIDKMLTNFDNKLTPKMRADIKAQGKTIYSIMTMASIIEKEAPLDYQKNDNQQARIISGIFWRRLNNGQRLESDATLSYIFNDTQPQHSGSELENASPYNTYRFKGLPPGPICNPGILAIDAAIHPKTTDYNYFLTPKGKDEVIYARTYEEHLKNKYQYLR